MKIGSKKTRCPLRECRGNTLDTVYVAFLISDSGSILWGYCNVPQARPQDMVKPHYRCRCGHRFTQTIGGSRTLAIRDGYRLYDVFEVAALVKGKRAGWRPEDRGRRRAASREETT